MLVKRLSGHESGLPASAVQGPLKLQT